MNDELAGVDESSPRPVPTRALRELPDQEHLPELGLGDLTVEEARAVLVAVSLFASRGRSRTRCKVGVMLSAVVASCQVEMARDGRVEPPAHPELTLAGIPWNDKAMRCLGIDREVLEAYWAQARNRADDACLPIEWALAFVPARFWPALLTLINWGPLEAAMRAEEAMTVLARTPIKTGTRKRAAGSPLAKGTLESRVDNLWGLMQALVDLRAKVEASKNPSLPLDLLRAWTFKPERIDLDACGAKEARTDTSGPPITDCARLIQRLYQEWQQAPKSRRYIRLRKLILATLLSLYGPREDALRMLDVDDYLPHHLFQDGGRGPALRFYPGKTVSHDQPHIVPLPGEPARWLEEWIDYTGCRVGQADSPLFPARQPKAGQPIKRISGLYPVIAGADGSESGHGSCNALLPRGDNPHQGYNPHAFRHTAYQAGKRAGVRAKQERPQEFAHIDPEDFARAVVGHELNQAVKDTYRDLNQQHLARVAIEHAWQALWQGGKRMGLDPAVISHWQQQVALIQAATGQLDRDLRLLYHRQTSLSQRTRTLTGDALHALLVESNQIASETQITIRDLNRFTDELAQAKQRLEHALTNEVPLPDNLTDEEHSRLLGEALGRAEETKREPDGPLADDLTASDLREVYGVTEQAINRWAREGFPHGRPAPWDNSAWNRASDRKKSLPVSAVDQTLLTEAQKRRLQQVRRHRALALAA